MSLTKATYSMIQGAVVNVLDFGATGDGTTDDTTAINAAFSYATSNSKTVYAPAGTYIVTNLLFGNQNVSSQSTAPAGLIGDGINTIFKAKSGTSGVVFKAWSIAGVILKNFLIDCNSQTGITSGIDTSWKPGIGPDLQNYFSYVWVQNYPSSVSAGWMNRNGNQVTFDHCIVRIPTSGNPVAWDCDGSGGQIYMRDCSSIGGILNVTAQNFLLENCTFQGVRMSTTQTGDNIGEFIDCYLYGSSTLNSCVSVSSPATSGHYTTGLAFRGTLFTPTVNGQSILDIGLVGTVLFDNAIVETNYNWSVFGSNCKNWAGSGNSKIVYRGFFINGTGTPTLNTVSGFDQLKYGFNNKGVITDVNTNGTYSPVVQGASTVGTATYSQQSGTWMKVGNQVTVWTRITWTGATGTGQLQITLPSALPPANDNFSASVGFVGSTFTGTGVGSAIGFSIASSGVVVWTGISASTGNTVTLNVPASGDLIFSISYYI